MKIFFSLLMFLSVSAAYSADLVNKDSNSYDIEIETGGTTHTSIGGNTTQMGGAPKGSTIRIKDTGSSIKVNTDKEVIIKDGVLSEN